MEQGKQRPLEYTRCLLDTLGAGAFVAREASIAVG
jgi:hypothetical protein